MTYTILCVDDEPPVLRSLAALFNDEFQTLTSDNGADALQKLDQNNVDVLISDQRMPGMKGIELLRRAAEKHPDTMRILLTGYSDLAAIVGSVNEGEVFRYVNKPWDKNDLLSTARQAAEISRKIQQNNVTPQTEFTNQNSTAGVLVLDEDTNTFQMVKKAIGANVAVHSATSVAESIDILEKTPIAVVVSEIKLIGGETTSFLKELKKNYPSVMTVVLTNTRDGDRVVELINGGRVFRYLPKPVREGLLKISIERAMSRHQHQLVNPVLVEREKVVNASSDLHPGIINRLRTLKARFAIS